MEVAQNIIILRYYIMLVMTIIKPKTVALLFLCTLEHYFKYYIYLLYWFDSWILKRHIIIAQILFGNNYTENWFPKQYCLRNDAIPSFLQAYIYLSTYLRILFTMHIMKLSFCEFKSRKHCSIRTDRCHP